MEREKSGLWNIGGEEAKGILEFNFVSDPHAYKKELRAISKAVAAAEASGKPITDPSQLKPQPKEIISVTSLEKPIADQEQFEKFTQLLLKNLRDEMHTNNLESVRDFVQRFSLTAR